MNCLLYKLAKSFKLLSKRNYVGLKNLIEDNEELKNFNYKDRSIAWEAYFTGPDAVVKVVEMGVNPDITDTAGGRIISAYSANNLFGMVEFLLKKGSDPNLAEINGETPLSWACFRNSLESAKVLLLYGADVNKQIGIGGGLPLDWAMNYSSPELVTLLKTNGAFRWES